MRPILSILILLVSVTLYSQDVKAYEVQLLEAYARYYELKSQEGNDIVLDPIETVPMPITSSESPSNWAKALYALPKIVPQTKLVFFILDTEGHFYHKDLQEVAWNSEGRVFTGETSKGNVNGHGIHCAGVIGSSKEGLLYPYKDNIRIIPYKVLRDNGSGSFAHIIAGIDAAVARSKQLQAEGYKCIISMSLGAQAVPLATVNAAVKRAVNAGIYVFAASGNNGTEQVGVPANAPGAMAVGSINEKLERSYFSNYGKEMYMVAPGEKINSTFINDTYAVLQGTSMACPNAAAALGFELLAGNQSINFTDILPTGWDKFTGNGYFTRGTGSVPVDTLKNRTILIELEGDYPLAYKTNTDKVATIQYIRLQVDSKFRAEHVIKDLQTQVASFFSNRNLILNPDDDLQEAVLFSGYFLSQFLKTKNFDAKILLIKGGIDGATVEIESKQINNRKVRYDAALLAQEFSGLPSVADIGLIVVYERPNPGNPNHCEQQVEFRTLRFYGTLPPVESLIPYLDIESCTPPKLMYTQRFSFYFYRDSYPVMYWPTK